MKCPKCSLDNRKLVKFCEECGAKLGLQCPQCKAAIPLGRKFCGECGCALSEAVEKKTNETESERKRVTVLFTDLSGYSAMSEKLDPEEVKSITSKIFREVTDIIHGYDGHVERVIGDEVMAIFGYPTVHEDDPVRAIRAAVDIHAGVQQQGIELQQTTGRLLNMHTGVNTGLVITGKTEIRQGHDGFAGDTINVASRLADMAEANEILVGPETYNRSRGFFEFKSLGRARFKGKTIPMEVYAVTGELTRTRTPRGRQVGTEMVGRDDELDQLLLQVVKTINSSGAVVNIMGEAGIGKSRLIAELKKQELMQHVMLLEGRAISTGHNLSFHPIIDFLKAWIGITDEDDEREAFRKLENQTRRILPSNADEVLAFLSTLLGMELTGIYAQRIQSIESENLDKVILTNVKNFLAELSKQTPLVIAIDDMHWADQSTLEFMAYLFRLARTHRVLFINVFRPDYEATSDFIRKISKDNFADLSIEMMLQPFDNQLSEYLINRLLNTKGFQHGIVTEIVKRAGGNPLFIEEVVRSFIDQGAIVVRNGGFNITAEIENVNIPSALQDVLMSRIDKLEGTTRNLLKMASVIGRNFFYKILAAVADRIEEIELRLSYLKGVQLIRERIRMEELEYLFKHALFQEAVYASILHEKREALHIKVARAIEKVFADKLHEFYGMLAYHYSQGGDLERSEDYMIRAGEQALKSSASSEALNFFQQALKIYTDRKGTDVDVKKVVMLEKNIGLALFNRGRLVEANEYFERVLRFHGFTNPRNSIVRLTMFVISIAKLIMRLYIPIPQRRRIPSQAETENWSLTTKMGIALSQIDPKAFFIEAFLYLDRVWKIDFRSLKGENGLFLEASGILSYSGISFTLARKLLEYGKSNYAQDDLRARLRHGFAGLLYYYCSGSWDLIKDYNQPLVEEGLKIGEVFFSTNYVYFYGLFYLDTGRFDLLERQIYQIYQIATDFDNADSTAFMYELKCKYLLKTRKFNEAADELDKAVDAAKKAGLKQYLHVFYLYKARMQTMLSDFDAAENSLLIADEYLSEVEGVPTYMSQYFLTQFYFRLCQLEKQMKDEDNTLLTDNSKTIGKIAKKMLRQSIKFQAERIEALRLMGSFHWICGMQKKAMNYWAQSLGLGERMNARLELSRTYMEIGRYLLKKEGKQLTLNGISASAYLAKARNLFQEMNLKWDQRQLDMSGAAE